MGEVGRENLNCVIIEICKKLEIKLYLLTSPSYNNSRCVYIYMFQSLHFSCPHKHVYNRKKLARRTIWRGLYRSDSYCGYRFKYWRK